MSKRKNLPKTWLTRWQYQDGRSVCAKDRADCVVLSVVRTYADSDWRPRLSWIEVGRVYLSKWRLDKSGGYAAVWSPRFGWRDSDHAYWSPTVREEASATFPTAQQARDWLLGRWLEASLNIDAVRKAKAEESEARDQADRDAYLKLDQELTGDLKAAWERIVPHLYEFRDNLEWPQPPDADAE